MLNVKSAFDHFYYGNSRARAVQMVREQVMAAADKKAEAKAIAKTLIGVEYDFVNMDDVMIRLTMMGMVDIVIQSNYEVEDGDILMAAAAERALKYRNDPKNSWAFVVTADPAKNESLTSISGLAVQAVVKEDGNLKKGSKGVLAVALHQKHVVDVEAGKRPTRQEFMAILMKQVQMTNGGASTYASDLQAKSGIQYRKEVK